MNGQGEPQARFQPRGEASLQVYRGEERRELSLDAEVVDLPPQWDPRLAKPPARARIQRVRGGHRLVAQASGGCKVNGRQVSGTHALRGGDEIEFEQFFGVYTMARQELPWPMAVVVWPPEGPPVEVRTHRARVAFGARDADMVIDDPTLDALHCVITRYRNGVMQVQDQGSHNGVVVDGQPVVDGMRIRDGAEIWIGNTRIKAWSEAPEGADVAEMPVQDQYDGLPQEGYDAQGGDELRPYAVELGPDYVQQRRRTFEDEVPTRREALGETVDVRPRRRPSGKDGYRVLEEPPDSSGVPDWAPLPKNAPRPRGGGARGPSFQESVTGEDWAKRDGGGLTLLHGKDRPIKPRRKR